MIEKPPTSERGPERNPTEEEVNALFETLTDGKEFVEIRKREDENGLYLWDIKMSNEDGITEYSYMRAGQYAEGSASMTAVHVAFYDTDDFPIGGHSVAKYKDGEWIVTP